MGTMHVRRKTSALLLATAAAAGLTTAAAVPASASATGYYHVLVQVGTFAPVMCLQPADPAGGGTPVVQQRGGQRHAHRPVAVQHDQQRALVLAAQPPRRPLAD
jgi:hypothetical protein